MSRAAISAVLLAMHAMHANITCATAGLPSSAALLQPPCGQPGQMLPTAISRKQAA
jgi:hypothetical protein